MSFTKNDRRRFEADRAARFVLPRRPTAGVVRIALLAAFGAVATVWAIAYHYSVKMPPMRVPAPAAPSATYDADAGEVPAPELERTP